MSRLINLTGKTFGYLKVIERDYEKEKSVKCHNAYWKCRCKCGNVCTARGSDLRQGKMISCGCKRKEGAHNREDLVGQKFGHLTVLALDLEKMNNTSYKKAFWKCQCDCGMLTSCSTSDLKSGHTQSCGCIKSKGEEAIIAILSSNNINFEYQKSFKDCFSKYNNTKYYFDFYLPDYNILIEYDGKQHFKYNNTGWNNKENFEKTQQRDLYKNQWCEIHNIPLIRIPYTDFEILSLEYIENTVKEVLHDFSFRFKY